MPEDFISAAMLQAKDLAKATIKEIITREQSEFETDLYRNNTNDCLLQKSSEAIISSGSSCIHGILHNTSIRFSSEPGILIGSRIAMGIRFIVIGVGWIILKY